MGVIKSILVILKRLRIPLPSVVDRRAALWVIQRKRTKSLENLFGNVELVSDARGYWKVDPMPSEEGLAQFYSEDYWASRNQTNVIVTRRDISHFEHLQGFMSLKSHSPLLGLNFGSGHGGISYLMSSLGHQLINVDPFENEPTRFQCVRSLQEIDRDVDLVYASHSIEHVTDIDDVMGHVKRLLRPNGIFYVEVPNNVFNSQRPILHPPHTYYFSPTFFEQLGFKILELSAYAYDGNEYGAKSSNWRGEVLRFVGQKSSL